MTWGSIAQKFKVSADDVASIINNIEVKSHETLTTHKDDVPSNIVDLRQIWKLDSENAQIIHMLQWIDTQKKWLNSKEFGASSCDIEEVPAIPELEVKHVEKPSTKRIDKNKLDKDIAKQLLRKAICVQASMTGYTYSNQMPLDVLVDVVSDYISDLANLYQKNVENEQMHASTGFSVSKAFDVLTSTECLFQDPFERTLYENGVHGIRELSSFYHTRVKNYRRKLMQKCEALKGQCEDTANHIYGGFGVPDDKHTIKSPLFQQNLAGMLYPLVLNGLITITLGLLPLSSLTEVEPALDYGIPETGQ
ncbi:hypothetical protein QYM36_011495 [Artemia franciscana]|uniref:Bromodomain associated domain-containing protein n=1 Tax=Artemia franciscana TaxID=6661 RepID=A0AA88HPM7_ARTSF|nr:hypothetical protein QYM36_011495 [Artemia franciscana]